MSSKELKLFGKQIFSYNSEKRSALITSNSTLSDPSEQLLKKLNEISGNSAIDININQDTVLGLSAAYRAINVIASSLAGLPLKHYKKSGNERMSLDSELYQLLKFPNEYMTGYIFRESLIGANVGWGNGYAIIKRNASSGKPEELLPIEPYRVSVFKEFGKIWYYISDENIWVPSYNMLHFPGLSFNGLIGFSPITIARESLSGVVATQRFGNTFFGNGANLNGILEAPNELSDTAYERLKKSFDERHKGVDNSNKTAILEGGMKYSKIQVAPDEAQFLETRKFQIEEIARWFGVPPHMLMHLERSTNNNIEHQAMEFVQYTLLPWANRWEDELNRKLLTSEQQKSEYFEHEFNGLMRADAKTRSEYYRGLFAIAAISPSQIAELENLPKPLNGDMYYVQGAYVPTDKIADFYKGKSKSNE